METNTHSHHLLTTLLLLLLLLTLLPTTTTATPTSPSPSPSPSLSPSRPPQQLPPQLNNIIDALIGAGDFSIWVSILSMSNPTTLPVSATLFIPQDTTTTLNNHPMADPFLFPYHVVPQRLTFSDLLLFRRGSRLPTLLPGKSISVTDTSPANFSLDGIPLTHPDLYATSSIAVHGVASVLDYSLLSDGHRVRVPPPPPGAPSPPFMPIGIGWRSAAAPVAAGGVDVAILVSALLLLLLLYFKTLSFWCNEC